MARGIENAIFAKYTYTGLGSWITSGTQKLHAGISSSSTSYKIGLEFDLSAYASYTINSISVWLYQTDYTDTVTWTFQNCTEINSNGTISGATGTGTMSMNKSNAWKGFFVNDLSSMIANGCVYIYGASASTYATVYDATTSYVPYVVVDYTEPIPEVNAAYVLAGTISGTNITFGTPLNHSSNVWGQKITPLGSTSFAVLYPKNDVSVENVRTFTLSGTTPTLIDTEQWLSATSTEANITRLSDTKFLITYDKWDSTNFECDTYIVACTIDESYLVTVGTPLKLADDSFQVMSVMVDTDRVVTVYNDGDYKMAVCTLSGTTITLVDTIELPDNIPVAYGNEIQIDKLGNDEVIAIYRYILNNGAGRASTITTNNFATGTFYARSAELTVTGDGYSSLFIRGNKVIDNTSSYIIDNGVAGEEYTNDNELIDDETHADDVGQHINDLLSNRKKVTLRFRYDPRMDIADTIKHITTYTTDNVFAGDISIEYNGAFIATLEGTVIA